MIEVKAHDFKANYTSDEVDRALTFARTGLSRRVQKNPAGAGLQVSGCFDSACVAYYLGRLPDAVELIEASCDCAGALFAAISAAPETTIVFPFRGGKLSGPSGKPAYGSGPGDWIGALLLGVARRRDDVVDILRDVPVSRFKNFPGEYDACFLHWVAALQKFLEGSDFSGELGAAEALSRPEALRIATPAIVARFRAIGPVLTAITANDQGALDQGLKAALEAHKGLFGRGKLAGASDSLVDRLSAGLAILALDRGLRLGVRSAYIPDWLIVSQSPRP